MKSPEIVLSLNEIMFYFTRAGVGAGLSFGLAEDFGRSSIWIAASGLDPARITSKTLKSLDEAQSSLCASQTEIGAETLLKPSGGKQLSALFAGPSVCDWILEKKDFSDKTQHFVVEKVDHPFLIVAAVGALKSGSWEICWQDSGGTQDTHETTGRGNQVHECVGESGGIQVQRVTRRITRSTHDRRIAVDHDGRARLRQDVECVIVVTTGDKGAGGRSELSKDRNRGTGQVDATIRIASRR